VIVDGLTSIVVDRGIEPQSGQTKDYKLVFTSSQLKNHAAFRSKRKDRFAKNQENVSKWSDILNNALLFQ
jgi:hypothetical protein